MVSIYNRRGVGYSGTGIKPAQPRNNMLGKVFDSISKTTEKLAQQNYALGKAEVINSVTQTAYEAAPDDPKKFNELINSGFEKGLQGLDDKTKKAVLEAANEKVKLLQVRVGKNLNTRLDRENSERVLNLADQTLNGVGGLLDINRELASAVMSGDKETTDALIRQRDEAYKKLNNYAGAKNMRGAAILGKNAAANMAKTGEQGMFDAIRDEMLNLSYDELKAFDETTFQDRKRFMEKTGLSQKSYDSLEKQIKNRRKAFDDADKRQIKAQNLFDAAQMVSNYNPETMARIKESGALGDKYNDFEKAILKAQEVEINPALVTNEDENFMGQFSMILPILASSDDGTPEYNGKLMGAMVTAQNALTEFRKKLGTSEESAQILDRTLTETVTNQEFADALNVSFSEGTLLREIAMSAGADRMIGGRSSAYQEFFTNAQTRGDLIYSETTGGHLNKRTKRLVVDKDTLVSPAIQKEMFKVAHEGSLLMAQTMNSGDYETAQRIGEETNKALIRLKVSPFINAPTMQKLEKELAEGKRALFNVGGDTYEFLGFSNNDVFVKLNI